MHANTSNCSHRPSTMDYHHHHSILENHLCRRQPDIHKCYGIKLYMCPKHSCSIVKMLQTSYLNYLSTTSLVFLQVSFLSFLLHTLAQPIGLHSFPPSSPSTFFASPSPYLLQLPIKVISSHFISHSVRLCHVHLRLSLKTSFQMPVTCFHVFFAWSSLAAIYR